MIERTPKQLHIAANKLSSTKNYDIVFEYPVVQIGIQAPSGTQFALNGGGTIEIGAYGIYELDLRDVGKIINMTIKTKEFLPTSDIYIDIVQEKEVSV